VDTKHELLAALLKRLDEIAEGNYSEAGGKRAFEDAARLSVLLSRETGGGDPKSWKAVGLFHWHRFLAIHEQSNRDDFDAAIRAFARCFIAGLEVPGKLLSVVVDEVADEVVDMLERAMRKADSTALDSAIQLLERVVDETEDDDEERLLRISNLSGALCARYEWSGDLADIDKAIVLSRRAAAGLPADDPARASLLSNLGIALLRRFERQGALADLNEAITFDRAAVDEAAPDDPGQGKRLANLCGALIARFEAIGAQDDLDAAVAVGHQAVSTMPRTDPHRAGALSNLAIAQRVRFEYAGELGAIDASVASTRQTIPQAPEAGPERAALLANLCASLVRRFEYSGDQADLDEAIRMARGAVKAIPGQPERAAYLNDLVTALSKRSERTGHLDDINEAITVGQEAVQVAPAGSRLRAGTSASLCSALWYRFTLLGDLSDLNAAIAGAREAVASPPLGGRDKVILLYTLSTALLARFERKRDPSDLESAIMTCREAADSVRGHNAVRGMALSNLCGALRARSEMTGEIADLDNAIEAGRQAVKVMPAGHQFLSVCLSNLCGALQARAERTGKHSMSSLKEAVIVGRRAVEATAADHPIRATSLSNLARALDLRFQQTNSPKFRDQSVKAFSEAAGLASAPPTSRVQAARSAAGLVAGSDPGRAAGLLDTAVRLLPQVAPRQLSRLDQEHALSRFAGLANDAAALTLNDAGPETAERALGLLELGRAVLYSQALDLDSDLNALSRQHPGLAARFGELRLHLDSPADLAGFTSLPGQTETTAARRQVRQERHRVVADFSALLDEIRKLAGFEDFLLPPPSSGLIAHAQLGPVISLNVSKYRSDALAITMNGIIHIPLPDLDGDSLVGQVDRFSEALHGVTDSSTALADLADLQAVLSEVLEWLWDAAAAPVLSHPKMLESLKGTADNPARVWWVPGGLLGRLPLHAAGYHRRRGGDTVMDRVVSSYTPTIRALARARQRIRSSARPERSLIVAMPTTPGQAPLRHARSEAGRLQTLLPDPVLLINEDPPSPDDRKPTKANVLSHLASANIAHFACHAATDSTAPSNSRLYLYDWQQDPLTVVSLYGVHLDHAQLAYLSACRTSYSAAGNLLDEAIHLTSSFQLTGFPQVIGTLWEVSDWSATKVAQAVYTDMRTATPGLAAIRAAQALRHAILELRDSRPDAPFGWASYVHFGA
jgi:tetratricopeptide (TPR) repeat protein